MTYSNLWSGGLIMWFPRCFWVLTFNTRRLFGSRRRFPPTTLTIQVSSYRRPRFLALPTRHECGDKRNWTLLVATRFCSSHETVTNEFEDWSIYIKITILSWPVTILSSLKGSNEIFFIFSKYKSYKSNTDQLIQILSEKDDAKLKRDGNGQRRMSK
jgi:hypothetical protein